MLHIHQSVKVNGKDLAGVGEEKVHDIFRRCPVNNIVLAVRDRYIKLYLRFELHRHIGYDWKKIQFVKNRLIPVPLSAP